MKKYSEYMKGREDGLQLAYKIVKDDGIDGLAKEIKFRNLHGISTSLSRKDLDVASQKMKEMTLDTVKALTLEVMHDEFGIGEKRMKRFLKRFDSYAESLMGNYYTWDDLLEYLRDDFAIDLKVRWNN